MNIIGDWKEYRRFWADRSYTIEESEASEVLRVKFYRAKRIYEKIENKMKIDCKAWIEGYCEGVRADKDTKDMLFWLLNENAFKK